LKKFSKEIRRVGIVANSGKVTSRSIVRQAASLIASSGRSVLTDRATAELAELSAPIFPDTAALSREVDLLLVFGGDGTMLRIAREIGNATTPLLGVNVGGLGFLTDLSSADLEDGLQVLWNGHFTLEERAMIEAQRLTSGQFSEARALNDIVISRGVPSRLIELDVSVDGDLLTRYRCDGLIISSPTGSTAYSLAAGGAVVFPTAEVFAITPICPHTLSNRSVIVSLHSVIQVKVVSERLETILSSDGHSQSELSPGEMVTIRRSQHSVRLVRLAGHTFFETLRRKLNWSGSNILPR
jgi:NAD+ kinase